MSGVSTMLGRAKTSTPSGLGNWDNSCYQNSIIQGLSSLPAFRTFVGDNIDAMNESHVAPTHHALLDITNRLNTPTGYAGTMWTPSALKSMDSWQQQDAQEYFSKLLDSLDAECSKSLKMRQSESGLEVDTQKSQLDSRPSPSPNPLEGLQAQRVACRQCGYAEGLSLSPFNCLTINLGRNFEYDLEELLDEHTALENIEGVECTKCTLLHVQSQLEQFLAKSNKPDDSTGASSAAKLIDIAQIRLDSIRKAFEDDSFSESGILKRCNISARSLVSTVKTKQVAVACPPKNLVIHINRSIFDDVGNQRKNTASVRFPPVFDLSRWCLGTRSSHVGMEEFERWPMGSTESMVPKSQEELLGATMPYQLRCVVTHYGRHENGHYVAYGKRRVAVEKEKPEAVEGKWYCFNDEIVTAVSEDDVLTRGNVFMLFYEAIEPVGDPQQLDTRHPLHGNVPVEEGTTIAAVHQTEEGEALGSELHKFDEDFSMPLATNHGAIKSIEEGNGNNKEHHEDRISIISSADVRDSAPSAATHSSSIENAARVSGVAPMMRTSSASHTLSQHARQEGSFAVPSPSVITAI